jgi:NAD(P)-dependent dehydrogenase (short-subunit alcohol dehydrogenase family)
MGFEGRVVIITGAAGGLGQVAAREFAQRRARLALVGKRLEPLNELAASLRLPSEQVLTRSANLVESEAASDLVQAVMGKFGRVDALVHLVGGWSGGKAVENVPDRDVDAMLQQHLWTSLHLFKAVVPHMRAAKWGRILAISSPTASHPAPERAPYAIGKAAQEALVLTLAQELKGSGVTANLVVVSTIDVAGERRSKPAASNTSWTTPEEITATLLHLCSDEAGTINGARIPVYGG